MATIINPYRASYDPYKADTSIGDSLAALGESLFGRHAAQAELVRQKSGQIRREETNLPLVADALVAGDNAAATRAGILAGLTPQNVAGYNQFRVANDPNVPLNSDGFSRAYMGVPGQSFASSPQGFAANQEKELKKTQLVAERSANTQRAIADQTPIEVVDPANPTNSIYVSRAVAIERGMRPVLTAASAEGLLKMGGFPANYKGWSPEQKTAAKVDPPADKILNYVEPGPGGVGVANRGRSIDGRTDMTTNQPLTAQAFVVNPNNQGGTAAFTSPMAPGAPEQRDLRSAIRNSDDVTAIGNQLLQLANRNPSAIGAVGNVRRLGQEVGDVIGAAHAAFGGESGYTAAVADARQKITTTLGPRAAQLLPSLFDPDLNSVQTLHGILVYKAAAALGQSGRDASDKDIARVAQMVGDPSSWATGPTTFRNKVAAILEQVQKQRSSDEMILSRQDVNAGRPAPGAVLPPAPQQGTTSTGVPYVLEP